MSKHRVAVLKVVSAQMSVTAAAAAHGLSRQHLQRLLRRYRDGGLEAVERRSRRPRSSPRRTPEQVRERIVALRTELTATGLDAGPVTIAWQLEREGLLAPSTSTTRRVLLAAGLGVPEPRKRPRSSWIRFEASAPNELWQSDVTHWHLADGTEVEIRSWLDDHSRYCSAARPSGGSRATTWWPRSARPAMPTAGPPPRSPTTAPSTRRAPPAGGTASSTCSPISASARGTEHRATPRPRARPKAHPAGRGAPGHFRLRYDLVDRGGRITLRRAGRLHHLGIGGAHARRRILAIVDEREVSVDALDTGEVLSTHRIEPDRSRWRDQRRDPGRWQRPRATDANAGPSMVTDVPTQVSAMSRLMTMAERVGFEPTRLSPNGFQDRRLQPLGHLSGKGRIAPRATGTRARGRWTA
jgi:transposase